MTAKEQRTNPVLVCTAAAVVVLLFSAASAWRAMPLWEAAFRSDSSPVSWLSSALLLANSAIAVRLGLDRALPARLAAWLALAIFVLAMDEQFMLHEYWQYSCQQYFELCRSMPWVRKIPIPMVGVVGILTALWLNNHLPTGRTRACLWSALSVGVWAIVVDQVEMPEMIAVFEEGFEVLSEAIFLGVLLSLPPATAT